MSCHTAVEECEETYDSKAMIQSLLRGEKDVVYRTALRFAEAGVADAQVMMGVLCETGISVPKSGLRALDWYHKAAAQDHPIAWSNLGTIYLLGLEDVRPDKKEAARCYARAQALRAASDMMSAR
jgi:TPR repeat protein